MAWRTVVVTKPAKMRVSNDQLVLSDEQDELSIPIEDLATVILESQQINLSAALLDAFNQKGVCLIVCDKKHMPSGIMLANAKNHRQSEIAFLQTKTLKPLLKRCWQSVIQQKIKNQFLCLKFYGQDGEKVESLIEKVQSGEPKNIEAQAAKVYWQKLFQEKFRRGSNVIPDIMLNYGYTILRGIVARALVGSGLSPYFGIHHSNKLNAYNLADDLMEPFRPMVDKIVIDLWQEKPKDFFKEHRYELANIGNQQVKIRGEFHTLIRATEVLSASYVSALKCKDAKELLLPELNYEC